MGTQKKHSQNTTPRGCTPQTYLLQHLLHARGAVHTLAAEHGAPSRVRLRDGGDHEGGAVWAHGRGAVPRACHPSTLRGPGDGHQGGRRGHEPHEGRTENRAHAGQGGAICEPPAREEGVGGGTEEDKPRAAKDSATGVHTLRVGNGHLHTSHALAYNRVWWWVEMTAPAGRLTRGSGEG
jgi:hypothetical protein